MTRSRPAGGARPGAHDNPLGGGIGNKDSRRHRRQRGARYTPPASTYRIRGAAFIDVDGLAERVAACDCPVHLATDDVNRLVIATHLHRHACPALRRWAT
jgi:hypothetical protein